MKKCRYCGRRHEPIPHDKTVVLGYHNGIPIIKAVPEVETGFLTFYCEYCDKEHTHGYGDGHRVAHCVEHYRVGANIRETHSPFIRGGYYLNRTMLEPGQDEETPPMWRPLPKWTSATMRKARKLKDEVG